MADVVSGEPHADPDAQATVTDFIDYTEHLPSDVRRSLELIKKLNESIYKAQNKVHELTKTWNTGVEATATGTVDEVAKAFRAHISYQKSLSSKFAAAAFAEATRMNEEIARHQRLLKVTEIKLDALPLPPSRDPTPQPVQQPQSPQASRPPGRARHVQQHGGPPRSRRKRVIVPGEVLPPPNPDSPTPSDLSDWESPEPPRRPSPKTEPRPKQDKSNRIKIPKAARIPRLDGQKLPKKERAPRPAGVMGTNVHSQVAGISTSNALAKLTPPPTDATPGSDHAPWMRLTEYEMAKLRKRMKKNAIWTPSDTMIRRELTDAGRGPENYRKAKQAADEGGNTLIDNDNLQTRDPDKPLVPGEIHLETSKTKLVNKGMSLNVQKKEKKLLLQQQLAEQARLDAEKAADNLGTLSLNLKNLFKTDRPLDSPSDKVVSKTPTTSRKRKRDSNQTASEESQLHSQLHSEIIVTPTIAKPTPKRRKAPSTTPAPKPILSPALASGPSSAAGGSVGPVTSPGIRPTTVTTTVPLAPAAPSPNKNGITDTKDVAEPKDAKKKVPAAHAPVSPAPKPEKRRLSLVIKPPVDLTPADAGPPTASRTQSRPASRRASLGPPPEALRDRPRRKSATPNALLPQTPTLPPPNATLASRRSKRPVPGSVIPTEVGGTHISVGKRQKKPKKGGKKDTSAQSQKEEQVVDEEDPIDPDEPRYCLCGDVSYGTMVMCENPDCEKEWFHLECVGLQGIPSRRAKWWCPECRVKLGKDKAA